MKLSSAMLPLIAIFSLLSACAPREGVEVGCTDFFENHHISGSLEVAVGDDFSMNLCSNPTTGFRWSEQADIGDKELVEQVDHVFVGPSDKDQPSPPGTPGEEVWTFRALNQGESTIYVEYSRPWEGGEKAEWTFILTVIVE